MSADQLTDAIRSNNLEALKGLLPSPHVNDLSGGHTPLNFAIQHSGNLEIIELLLRQYNIDLLRRNGNQPRFENPKKMFNEWNFKPFDTNVAGKTPMEVAVHSEKGAVIALVDRYLQQRGQEPPIELPMEDPPIQEPQGEAPQPEQVQVKEPSEAEAKVVEKVEEKAEGKAEENVEPTPTDENDWKEEATKREELQNIESDYFNEVMAKVAGKDEETAIQMMERGEIPANMWSASFSRCNESQKDVPSLKEREDEKNRQLTECIDRLKQMQENKEKVERELKDIQQALRDSVVSPQTLQTMQTLASAEQNTGQRLEVLIQNVENVESALLDIGEIAYILNMAGMAHISKKLMKVAERDDFTEIRLKQIFTVFGESISLKDRLKIQFVIDMLKHRIFPPYDDHLRKCEICKMSVAELLLEYQITFKESELAQLNLSSCDIMFLNSSDIPQLLETNTKPEILKTESHIDTILQIHHTFLADQKN